MKLRYVAFEWSHRQVWENSVEKVMARLRLVDMINFFEKVALVLVYSSRVNFTAWSGIVSIRSHEVVQAQASDVNCVGVT